MIRRARVNPSPTPRRLLTAAAAIGVTVSLFAGVALATADLEQNEIVDEFADNESSTVDLGATDASVPDRLATPTSGAPPTVPPTPATTVSPTTVPPTTVPATTVTPSTTAAAETATTAAPAPTTTTAPVPATTVPPTTAPPPPPVTSLGLVTDAAAITPLTVPPRGEAPSLRLIGFGDSVMLGSANQLTERGFVVDAVKSRQFSAALPELQAIRDNGFLGSAVVVHLGTNGSFPQSSLDQMMAILAGVPIVVFVTGKADRGWIAGNNEKIRALPNAFPNVTVLDWEVLGPQCQGDCFYDDNIHLNGAGQRYYADLIAQLLGL